MGPHRAGEARVDTILEPRRSRRMNPPHRTATALMPARALWWGMLAALAQGLGPFASPPGLLVGLVVLAVVLLVGRVVLALAWRLVLIAIAAVAVLWLLGMLGFQTGVV